MTFFAEQMKTLADAIVTCTRERGEQLTGLRQDTANVLAEARSFLEQFGQEHRARTEELKRGLADNHRERSTRMQEQRQEYRQARRQNHEELQRMFTEANHQRHEQVNRLREYVQQSQRELADDFRRAREAWRTTAQTRFGSGAPRRS